VTSDPIREGHWVVAGITEEKLEGVSHDADELNHLENSQVFFPPEKFLHLWSDGGHHVICVHNNVNEGVEEEEEC
jgi:hypothetical protein